MQERLEGKRRRRRRSKKVLEYSKQNSRQWNFKQESLSRQVSWKMLWTAPKIAHANNELVELREARGLSLFIKSNKRTVTTLLTA